ncbi:MAG: class I SAM-dependent methyltransferase [Pseudomonadota bacterium]
MSREKDARHTLIRPFETGDLTVDGKHWLFLNAQPLPELDDDSPDTWASAITAVQPHRPSALGVEAAGYASVPTLEDRGGAATAYDGALVLLGKARKRNELWIADAMRSVPRGAPVLICGAKTSGITPARSWLKRMGYPLAVQSKNHAIVLQTEARLHSQLPTWEKAWQDSKTVDGLWQTAPGGFSAGAIDVGSRLLAEAFSDRIRGKVADLGAGWGYLSAKLLEASNRVEALDLFEADHHALAAARKNLSAAPATFHWADITSGLDGERPRGPYDWVIMNPPFHTGDQKARSASPDLGKGFIQAAARCLPSGGRLLMVANRQLPYEAQLQASFRRVLPLAQRDGFKVFEAVK